jgi:hypothetical protein
MKYMKELTLQDLSANQAKDINSNVIVSTAKALGVTVLNSGNGYVQLVLSNSLEKLEL